MNDPLYNRLREASWRRKLSPDEEAALAKWLASHPETLEDWEAEAGLNEILNRLPEPQVATNFTARVVAAAEREAAASVSSRPRRWLLPSLIRKAAFAAVIFGFAVFSYSEYRGMQRKRIADSVATISRVAATPSPEVLKNIKAISYMSQAPGPDEELLKLLSMSK